MSEMVSTGMTARDAKEKLAGLLRKIRGLLDKANGTDNEHEASAFRAHAEKLMKQYHLDEEQLIAADPIAVEPIQSMIVLCGHESEEFAQQYAGMFWNIARHTGIRARISWARDAAGKYNLVANAFGYEGDLRYAEMLFTEARIVFQEKLEPKLNPSLSEAENIYRMRSAGIDRQHIAEMVFGHQGHAEGLKVGRVYAEECARRGEEAPVSGRGVNIKLYRKAYAGKFVDRFDSRLRMARNAADSEGGALVLHGRKERVDEAFYGVYPELRPSTAVAEQPEPCAACKKAKSGHCRQHPSYRWTAADQRRWERQNYSAEAQAGQAAGRAAADSVQLTRPTAAKRLGE
jgi:hypothetical protein